MNNTETFTRTKKQKKLCATTISLNIKRKGFRDLTGVLPHKSNRGNLYVIVMYDYDSNVILSEPIKNVQEETIRYALLKIHNILKSRVSDPKFHIMDNDCSSDLKEAMKKYAIDLQLDPPHTYRHNVAEREIRTCKNNFISGLSKIYPDSPISEWNRLLSKCLITLCLPRNSRARPYLSAHTYLFGLYDFNKYLIEPPVTRMIVNSLSK